MSESLQDSDPRQLGAYRLSQRLSVRPEGVVYLGHDSAGTAVSVAMLSQGAAADPAARDRFVAAVTQESGVSDPPEVLASNTSTPATSWVAVRHDDTGAGAGAYLDPVSVQSTGGSRRTPGYVPYWAGASAPASARWSWRSGGRRGAAVAAPRANRAVVIGLLAVLLLVVGLLAVLYMWLSQLSQQAMVEPEPPPSSPQQEESSPPPEQESGQPEDEQESSPQPDESEDGGQESPQPSPVESPSDVPSVELDEDEQPGGEEMPDNPA